MSFILETRFDNNNLTFYRQIELALDIDITDIN